MTLIGDKIYDVPVELHDQQLNQLENRFLEISEDRDEVPKSEESIKNKRILPVKALNEVQYKIWKHYFNQIKTNFKFSFYLYRCL